MSKTHLEHPEFSRPLAVDKIPPSGMEQTLNASEAERKKLAERFGLLDLSKLEAQLTIHPARANQTIEITGTLNADITQQCVVTLEPLANHIQQDIKVLFAAPELLDHGAGPSDMEEEELEPILNGMIDLGELVAQNLGIAIDPYPRKPGVGYVEAAYGAEKAAVNPFAKLAELAKKPNKSK